MDRNLDKKLILKKIKDHYKFTKDVDFADFLGITPQNLSSWYSRNTFDFEILYTKCLEINVDFLFTGKGDIVKNLNEIEVHHLKKEEKKNDLETQVFKLKTDKLELSQYVPLYNLEATAGMVSIFNSHNDLAKPIDFISIPNLPKCDGAIYVSGDSMYPLLKSGDIIMFKQIHDIVDNIFYGEMYLVSLNVDDEEFVSVKWVQKSDKGDDYIKLVSQNTHHQSKDVKLSKIRALALVKASIRMNSMY